jgi:hypothetical protein
MIADNAAYRQYGNSQAECDSAALQSNSDQDPDGDGTPDFPAAGYGGVGWLRHNHLDFAPGTPEAPLGYTLGANGTGWRDVVRLIYTGCNNGYTADALTTPACPTGAGSYASARLERCSPTTNPVREWLISNWSAIVQNPVDCNGAAGNTCAAGLRQAYRRGDYSGTTAVFLELLGLSTTIPAQRSILVGGVLQQVINPINANHPFCDGGDLEGFLPSDDVSTVPGQQVGGTRGDPLTRPCKDTTTAVDSVAPIAPNRGEDDLCGANGQMGVVRAIRTPPTDETHPDLLAAVYPPVQCTRGAFGFRPWMNTSLPVCPDGTRPSAGECQLPFYRVDRNGDGDNTDPGDRDYNCLNDANSRPSGVSVATDGRVYNSVWRTRDGVVRFVSSTAFAVPVAAQWRQNMAVLDLQVPVPGGAFPTDHSAYPTGTVCQEADATRQIGCLVANTTCTVGVASVAAASHEGNAPWDDEQEPFALWDWTPDGSELSAVYPADEGYFVPDYPLGRELFVNAIGGFSSITADCLARGGSAAYCADQVLIAETFYDPAQYANGGLVKTALEGSGYLALRAPRCDSPRDRTVSTFAPEGCGRTQAEIDADPSACIAQ